jgi:thymidylate synthase (FAD)
MLINQHWSPFDQVDLTFEIITSRAIGRQLLRHWSSKFQEFSQRYAEVIEVEDVTMRKAGSSNRQSSVEEMEEHIQVIFKQMIEQSKDNYKRLLEYDVANESARFILPGAATTKMYMKMSLRTILTFLNIRLDQHAQLEAREIAGIIRDIVIAEFPIVSSIFDNFKHVDKIQLLDMLVLKKYKLDQQLDEIIS